MVRRSLTSSSAIPDTNVIPIGITSPQWIELTGLGGWNCKMVQIGDVRLDEGVGMIAIATPTRSLSVEEIQKQMKYT
jgi:hypothetical protein